jgi:hypothetical protein
MGFLQNYRGLEPAYKDGCDLPRLGIMTWRCIEIGQALTLYWRPQRHFSAACQSEMASWRSACS